MGIVSHVFLHFNFCSVVCKDFAIVLFLILRSVNYLSINLRIWFMENCREVFAFSFKRVPKS